MLNLKGLSFKNNELNIKLKSLFLKSMAIHKNYPAVKYMDKTALNID